MEPFFKQIGLRLQVSNMTQFHCFLGVFLALLMIKGIPASIIDDRIVDGYLAKPGEFPHQVSLREKFTNDHFCGGSIIDHYHIVTAAHCVEDDPVPPFNFTVSYGSINLNDNKNTVYNSPRKVFVHPAFSLSTRHRDIAIVKLKKRINYNKFIQPIRLNSRNITNGQRCVVSGWGRWVSTNFTQHPELKAAHVHIVDVMECKRNYSDTKWKMDPKTIVCAGNSNGGNNTCRGDSGGPLTCKNKMVGLSSWGRGCGLPGYPKVFTKVRSHLRWIRKCGARPLYGYNSNSLISDELQLENDENDYE
uniref:Trypsin-10 n=1 Tax=Nilaparvata lugens TaxID=108931 RepID=A0A068FBA5_NILLU|nr:trypsin-10 [Nilaparvata lugens]